MAQTRDYKAEYARRIASATARGLSRSQGRGHARSNEAQIKGPKVKSDDRLEAALKVFRQTRNRTNAAKAFNIAPERFGRFLRENIKIEGRGRSLKINDDRRRDMTVISNGKIEVLGLRDFEQASQNGSYLAAVGQFLKTNDPELLLPFNGQAVIDFKGKSHPFETDPNALYWLAAQGEAVFHEIYKLVLTGE